MWYVLFELTSSSVSILNTEDRERDVVSEKKIHSRYDGTPYIRILECLIEHFDLIVITEGIDMFVWILIFVAYSLFAYIMLYSIYRSGLNECSILTALLVYIRNVVEFYNFKMFQIWNLMMRCCYRSKISSEPSILAADFGSNTIGMLLNV
mgnify:CR=1 FL=1